MFSCKSPQISLEFSNYLNSEINAYGEVYLEGAMPSGLWSASTLKAHLGSTRFMKVARILHEDERDLVVKIFVKPEKLEDEVVLEVFTSLNRTISFVNH